MCIERVTHVGGWFLCIFLFLIVCGSREAYFFCDALYAEDAGALDFTVSTAGHGAVGWVHPFQDTVVTTDTTSTMTSPGTSCYVASRKQQDGSLVWRRNVCSTRSSTPTHAVATFPRGDVLYTADHASVVRAWSLDDASLLWDISMGATTTHHPTKLWTVLNNKHNEKYVAVASQEQLFFVNADTGETFDTLNALTAMNGKVHKRQTLEWLALTSSADNNGILKGVFAYVNEDGIIQSGNDIFTAELEIGNDQVKDVKAWNLGKHVLANSVVLQAMGENNSKWHALAVTQSGSVVDVSMDDDDPAEDLPASKFHPKWTVIVAVEPTSEPSMVRIKGKASPETESAMALFRFDEVSGHGWERLHGRDDSPEVEFSSVAYCPLAGLVVATGLSSLQVYRHDSLNVASTPGSTHERLSPLSPMTTSGDLFVPDGDSVSAVSVLECSRDTVKILIGTERGTSTQLSLRSSKYGETVTVTVDWTAEEGLSSVSSVVFVEASHLGFDDLVEEQDSVAARLSLSGRLASQWQDTLQLLSAAGLIEAVSHSNRDHIFGFVKMAAVLSPKSHRVWGMSTSGKSRGSVRWSLDLPKAAMWHSMVHGSTNSAKAMHGINGDTHSRELLILSAAPEYVEWMCVDGTSGAVLAQDSIAVRSTIIQVLPIYGSSFGGCRQASLLLHEDLKITVVPTDAETMTLAETQLNKTPNGLYAHHIDKASSHIQSYKVTPTGESKLTALPIGITSFGGEKILTVAYPIRHETVQSMSTILGDNSLLLKYINPHMAVVITALDDTKEDQSLTELATNVDKTTNKQPRKPAGAGTLGESRAASEPAPNMFVNLVDTVSSRVLHRTSHANVDTTQDVPVVITENWVIYSFVNSKSRRNEIGVLTLHEGMIDSAGMTFFSHPEQVTSFSSFDARESTPVVLAKTYAFPMRITALGVTSTRQGISSQNILLASGDGALNSFHKKVFETRRPLGEVKPEEKLEGLIPYQELIPASPLLSLTYNQTMEPFTRLVSAGTSLESQSLVMGFGGPDLFFTRTSPTKGFDLLPETFNKILVGIVTVGVVIAVLVVQRMGNKKALEQSWL